MIINAVWGEGCVFARCVHGVAGVKGGREGPTLGRHLDSASRRREEMTHNEASYTPSLKETLV